MTKKIDPKRSEFSNLVWQSPLTCPFCKLGSQGGRLVLLDRATIDDWNQGTYNHLLGKAAGRSLLVSRLMFDTTEDDLASFFRNFHLEGNGITLLADVTIFLRSITKFNPEIGIQTECVRTKSISKSCGSFDQ